MILSSSHHRKNSAMVLIMVVVMIAISVMIMSRMASSSLRQAALANEEERDMRNRWASISLARFGIDRASRGELQAFDNEKVNSVSRWLSVRLAEKNWRLLIGDEAGKVSLSRLANRYDANICAQVAGKLNTASSNPVDLLPDVSKQQSLSTRLPAYRWEHWFDENKNILNAQIIADATKNLTLWSNGKVHLRRASPATIDVLWRQIFGRSSPRELMLAVNRPGTNNIEQVVTAMSLGESQARLVRDWFTLRGECYSTWVFCEDDRRFRAMLFVQWGGGDRSESRGYEYF